MCFIHYMPLMFLQWIIKVWRALKLVAIWCFVSVSGKPQKSDVMMKSVNMERVSMLFPCDSVRDWHLSLPLSRGICFEGVWNMIYFVFLSAAWQAECWRKWVLNQLWLVLHMLRNQTSGFQSQKSIFCWNVTCKESVAVISFIERKITVQSDLTHW